MQMGSGGVGVSMSDDQVIWGSISNLQVIWGSQGVGTLDDDLGAGVNGEGHVGAASGRGDLDTHGHGQRHV